MNAINKTACGAPLDTSPGIRESALSMARRGFAIIPLLPNSKVPFEWNIDDPNRRNCSERDRRLAGGIRIATRDENKINAWFDHELDPAFGYKGETINFGVSGRGHVILDVDVKGGKRGIEGLLSLPGIENTFTVTTPTGGMHLYYSGPEVSQRSAAEAVDVRSWHGYVVGAGSLIDEQAYEITRDVPVAPVDPELFEHLKRGAEPHERSSAPLTELDLPVATDVAIARAKAAEPAAAQGRNNAAFELAAELKDVGLSAEKIFEVLDAHWNPRNADPEPLDEFELRRCCENAWRYGRYAPGVRNPAVEFADVADVLESVNAESRIAPTAWEWKEPTAIPPREWVYGRHYIKRFTSATIAPGGVGKSTIALAEAIAMASGRDLLGHPVRQPARVWYINLEDPADELDRRIAAICKHYGISEADFGGRLFVDNGRDRPVCIAADERSGFKVTPCADALLDGVVSRRIDVLIVDPFVRSHGVAENDNTRIAAVVGAFAKIADRGGCAVDLVHHIRKNGGAEVTSEDARGGGAFVDLHRSVRILNRMSKDEAEKLGIRPENRLSYFRVDKGKVNLVKASDRSDWYCLVSVPLHNGARHLAGDEIGVATRFAPPTLDDLLPDDALALAWEAIHAGRFRFHYSSEDWAGHAVVAAWGLSAGDEIYMRHARDALDRWTAEGWFKIVEEKDASRRVRKFLVTAARPVGCSTAPPPEEASGASGAK